LFRLSLRQRSLQIKNKRLATLRKLDEIMMSVSISVSEVAQRVVDTIAFELGFSFGVIAIVEPERGTLKRVAVSRTEAGLKGVSMFPVNFHELRIPLTATQNLGVKALKENKLQITNSLYDMLVPAVSKDFSDKLQVFTGIKTTYVFPIISQGKQLGIMIVSFNKDTTKIKRDEIEIVQELLGVVGVAINNALLYQSLHETTRKLAQANIKLEQLDKLKDDFVSVASHELRTPMTAIRSYSWMALNKPDIKLSEKMKKYLSRVLISTERLINLVNDMLNVSRIEAGRIEIRPQIFDIGVLVDDVMAEVTPKANEKMVQLEVGKVQLPKIFADPDKVPQVLLNLIQAVPKIRPVG
ncbi:MAG: Multi-sensor hybrid histidine kinase, partial [Candidatus Daviesbacteria bacterium GW2011_GWA2_42_7]